MHKKFSFVFSCFYPHISIYNTEGNLVIINVDKGDKKGYYYISSNWDTNITYTIVINSNEVFSLDNVNNITVSFEKIKYNLRNLS